MFVRCLVVWLVVWLVGRSVIRCHNFIKGGKGVHPCVYRSTCFRTGYKPSKRKEGLLGELIDKAKRE